MSKRYGTNHIIQRVRVRSEEAGEFCFRNFGGRSLNRSVQLIDTSVAVLAPNEIILRFNFTHTAFNSGNWRVDSARFVRNALQKDGKTYRYEILPPELVERIELDPPEEK